MSPLPKEVEAAYTVIIDEILRNSDLDTVSSKRIRQGLQAQVDEDISGQKEAINALIVARYDKLAAQQNGAGHQTAAEPTEPVAAATTRSDSRLTNGIGSAVTAGKKRTATSSEADHDDSATADGELESSAASPPPPKKKHKKSRSVEDSDAAMAARMQAEEYSRARNTRGVGKRSTKSAALVGGRKKTAGPIKKKKKSKAKVTDDLDSDADGGSGEKKEVNRSGGFHKPLALSPPLAALLNETQLSRPQTVKRIWEYIKARDLQDPADKRQIRCDAPMRDIFKTDRIHMFTMNKVLNANLYAIDE